MSTGEIKKIQIQVAKPILKQLCEHRGHLDTDSGMVFREIFAALNIEKRLYVGHIELADDGGMVVVESEHGAQSEPRPEFSLSDVLSLTVME